MLIIFAGLPGTGKTTLARKVAHRIGATFLRIDSIERALTESSLKIYPTEDAGYMVGYAVAEDNLRNGRTVVADSVNPIELTRKTWLEAAERAGCPSIEVEVICSDETEHRQQVEGRTGPMEPTWQDVLDREYHPWNRDRIVIDTAYKSAEQCVEELLTRSGLRMDPLGG